MFTHPEFEVIEYEKMPLNRDIYLMGEEWLTQYEAALTKFFAGEAYENVGYISRVALRSIDKDSVELSWYANVYDRFHEVAVRLPREAIIVCVDCPDYDEKPHVFVKTEWLLNLHTRPFSAFAMIDAIGVKDAIKQDALGQDKLIALRNRIDDLAERYPDVSFVSFADSLLLKTNWSVGHVDSDIKYSYQPEQLLQLFPTLEAIYQEVLGLKIYAVLTQGVNEYPDPSVLHVAPSRNHVCLNSLGLPFAQLLSIDTAARNAIREKAHRPDDLYIDELFYHSIRFRYGFDKHAMTSANYLDRLSAVPSSYYVSDIHTILDNLEAPREVSP